MRPCLQVVILLQDGDAGSDCGDNDDDGGDDDDGGGDGGGGDDDDAGGDDDAGDYGGDDDGGEGDHDGDDGNNGRNSATSVRQQAEKLRLFCRQFKQGPICIYLKQSCNRQRCQNGNFR